MSDFSVGDRVTISALDTPILQAAAGIWHPAIGSVATVAEIGERIKLSFQGDASGLIYCTDGTILCIRDQISDLNAVRISEPLILSMDPRNLMSERVYLLKKRILASATGREEKRAELSPEEQLAQEEEDRKYWAKEKEKEEWWAELGATRADFSLNATFPNWELRTRAFLRLGYHNFFLGSGPMDVEVLSGGAKKEKRVEITDPPDSSEFHVLKEAIFAAGLQDKILLSQHKTIWPDGKFYVAMELSILDFNLIPHQCQEAWGENQRIYDWHPSERNMLIGMVNMLPNGYCGSGMYGAIRQLLYYGDHPLVPHLIEALCGKGAGIPLWESFHRYKGGKEYQDTVTYEDLPRRRVRHYASDNVVATLALGIVVPWGDDKALIRLDRHEDFSPGDWRSDVSGARILHVERTNLPLTKTVRGKKVTYSFGDRIEYPQGFQVFGMGSSQQTDKAPCVEGKDTICLLCWSDPADYTITICVTLGEDGFPILAWVDGSAT